MYPSRVATTWTASTRFTPDGVTTFGVGTVGYQRSDSLWLSALTYAAVVVAGRSVVFRFEAGTPLA